jgi:thioredoxin reductase (NADPH)
MSDAKPVLLSVDDDEEVLRAIERDLRLRYGQAYRIFRAESGTAGLELLERLLLRDDPVALLLSDQRMPEMTGVEFLDKARALVPHARRVLLTAYADTDAAIRAINQVKIHHYLMKPWDPPEQHLYPYLDELLEDWRSGWRPSAGGLRVIGNRYSPRAHALRDFLGRNLVPFRWLDLDSSPEAVQLLEAIGGVGKVSLPVVLFPDGNYLGNPELRALGERIGLRTRAEKEFYDLVVIGSGPAGLAAGVYGASEGLRTLLVERDAPGGQAGTSSNIENYLGFPAGLTGADLTRRAVAQARKFGAEILTPLEAAALRVDGSYRVVTLSDGTEISCGVLLVTTGVDYQRLDVPGADSLTGAGIYYGAAMTEALSCRDEEVYLIGGGNSAGQAAMYFARYARQVTLLCRGADLRQSMSHYLIHQIGREQNIRILTDTCVTAVRGGERLEEITIRTGESEETLPATSLFVFIGAAPRTEWLGDTVLRDEHGFVLTGPDLPRRNGRPRGWPLAREPYLLETSVPGVFAAGDVRHQSVKRVASAVGEGSIAVQFTHRFLTEG